MVVTALLTFIRDSNAGQKWCRTAFYTYRICHICSNTSNHSLYISCRFCSDTALFKIL